MYMSNRELAIELINQIPEYKLSQVIFFLQGAAIPDKKFNIDTLAAMEELERGEGHVFSGSTEDLFKELVE